MASVKSPFLALLPLACAAGLAHADIYRFVNENGQVVFSDMKPASGRYEVVDIRDEAIAALYERRLVLVRPDGHVAWRGDALPRDVAGLVAAVTGRRTAPS